MVKELHDLLEAGEIDDEIEDLPWDSTEFNAANFIKNMYDNLSEDDESAIEQLSERQIATVYQLYEGYCNGEWLPLDEY